jgi:GNAT superfamily N-acetyltransferase
VRIRPLDAARDAEDVVALVRACAPFGLVGVDEWRHRQEAIPERVRLRHVVAEVDGHVVGDGQASYSFIGPPTTVWTTVRVLPEHRRRGIGAALFEAVRAHVVSLAAPVVLAQFDESRDGVRFASARGFAEARAEVWSVLDPRTVADRPDASVELVPARDLDPRDLHRVDEEATRDMPSHDAIESIDYEEWLGFVWRYPFFSKDGSFGAVVDGELAAVSFLLADPAQGRAINMFTGTASRFRGRGLALAVKLASTHWAAAQGITQIATTNDETNAPMLAVNRRLGYRAAGRRVEYVAETSTLAQEGRPT